MKAIHAILLAAVLSLAWPGWALALEIRDVQWGFDGQVVPGRFTPVWVLVDNGGDDLFAGDFTLKDVTFSDQGVPVVVPNVVISSGARRWVEFVPLIGDGNERWAVSWKGTEIGQVTLDDQPRSGSPALVMLDDPEQLSRPAGVKTFREDRFPTSVTELDTLQSVVMDHMPQWQPPQRQAFIDWLKKGGIVHLASDGEGHFPEFTDELAILNAPLDRYAVGAGLVARHDLPRRQITNKWLQKAGFPAPPNPESEQNQQRTFPIDQSMLSELRNLTRPIHHWGLIYTCAIIYLLLIGPVNWRVGRRVRDFRVPLLFGLVSIVVFTWLFFTVGRRGDGEITITNSLSLAQPLGDGTYDVTQWSSVFVTRSGMYDITHAGPHNLYGVCASTDAVLGRIVNGKEGRFDVDIPLFSWREFIHRGKMSGLPDFTVTSAQPRQPPLPAPANPAGPPGVYMGGYQARNAKVSAVTSTTGLPTLHVAGAFPKTAAAMWAYQAGQWCALKISWEGKLVEAQLPDSEQPNLYPGWETYEPEITRRDPAAHALWVKNAFIALARSILARDQAEGRLDGPGPAGDKPIHIYILDAAPNSLGSISNGLNREIGYVLIHQVVAAPEEKP